MPTTRSRTPGPAGAVPAADRRAELGRFGEDIAVRYLCDSGWRIVERNWRCERGEIDIVARDGDALVVCEVKTRRTARFGTPQEAVTRVKLARLRRLAVRWLQEHEEHAGELRIDVIAVRARPDGRPTVEHLRGVA